ncbi:hypothetical protein RND81_06G148200 [Saponaria officinalis]|uniref:Uncharacterized protein n=1 Tax=Saponaria officinalis TaxID=3572 RepID=A0AAW1KBY8_SAPOF
MDYPHGNVDHHHHHHHHNRRDDDEDNNRNNIYPPPPPFSHSPFPPPPHMDPTYPPPPPHQSYAPPPPSFGGAYNPPPPHAPPHIESQYHPPPPHHSSHTPGFIGSHFHGGPEHHGPSTHPHGGGPGSGPELGLGHLANRPSHKIHCKAGGERFAVGIRDGKVVLTHPDQSDLTQHWYKDEKYSTKVKDKEGHPSFMLVNKGTGQAVKHSISCHPVQLAPYKPDVLDESVLWTESKDLGSGFRTIRTVNNIHLVMDAWNADKDHGGIHDGTLLALYETWKGDNQNQQWQFVRH